MTLRSAASTGAAPRAALVGGALVLLALLSGCTGSPEPTPTPTPTESASAPPQVTDIIDPAGSGEGWVGALTDTEVKECATADGGWHIAGTATNSSPDTADYRIYVSVFADGDELRGLKQVNVAGVSPGATVDWAGDVAVEGDNLYCVLRVERYVAPPPPTDDSDGSDG